MVKIVTKNLSRSFMTFDVCLYVEITKLSRGFYESLIDCNFVTVRLTCHVQILKSHT